MLLIPITLYGTANANQNNTISGMENRWGKRFFISHDLSERSTLLPWSTCIIQDTQFNFSPKIPYYWTRV